MACARGRGKKNRTALDTDDLIEGTRQFNVAGYLMADPE
jgi:hypothetical protein